MSTSTTNRAAFIDLFRLLTTHPCRPPMATARTGGAPGTQRHVEVVNVLLDSVRDRSEPPSDPTLGEPAQTGSPGPRSLPRRAHHLASVYDFP